eukprot:TRINITY_DN50329_c0_g1_i1.p1 TRINITY_DN50329_c0_g1~~TRINITY_DN50329_c0_g1_i1.p1  ORF type:complete len:548 (-),score=74.63 TRINITY_DN50329_c0_g1_i1:125-1768(-)
MEEDLYAVLGVSSHATRKDIRAAYKALARRLHPDKLNPCTTPTKRKTETAAFQRLQNAYEVLHDPARRKEYDAVKGGSQPQPAKRPPKDNAKPRPPSDSYRHTQPGATFLPDSETDFESDYNASRDDSEDGSEADQDRDWYWGGRGDFHADGVPNPAPAPHARVFYGGDSGEDYEAQQRRAPPARQGLCSFCRKASAMTERCARKLDLDYAEYCATGVHRTCGNCLERGVSVWTKPQVLRQFPHLDPVCIEHNILCKLVEDRKVFEKLSGRVYYWRPDVEEAVHEYKARHPTPDYNRQAAKENLPKTQGASWPEPPASQRKLQPPTARRDNTACSKRAPPAEQASQKTPTAATQPPPPAAPGAASVEASAAAPAASTTQPAAAKEQNVSGKTQNKADAAGERTRLLQERIRVKEAARKVITQRPLRGGALSGEKRETRYEAQPAFCSKEHQERKVVETAAGCIHAGVRKAPEPKHHLDPNKILSRSFAQVYAKKSQDCGLCRVLIRPRDCIGKRPSTSTWCHVRCLQEELDSATRAKQNDIHKRPRL